MGGSGRSPAAGSSSRLRWREARREALGGSLEQLHGVRDPPEAVLTEAYEPEAGGSLILARLLRVSRHDHLAPVGSSADPGRGVDRKPGVVHVVERRIATVDPDADLDLDAIRPRPLAELALRGDGGLKRGAGLSNTTKNSSARVSTAWPAHATAVS